MKSTTTPALPDTTPQWFELLKCILALCLVTLLGATAHAVTIIKANNQDNLNLTTSWVGGVVPGSADQVNWDATVTGPNSVILGAPASWSKVSIGAAGGLITIGADGNAITLSTSGTGFAMSSSAPDVTLNCDLSMTVNSYSNNVALGKTLAINGNITGTKTLGKLGDGTMILNGANTHAATQIGHSTTTRGGIVIVGSNTGLGSGTTVMNGTGTGAIWLRGGITIATGMTLGGAAGNGVTDYGNLRNLWGNNTITGLINGNASPRIGCDSDTLEIKTSGTQFGNGARGPNFIGDGNIVVSAPIKKWSSGTSLNTLGKALGKGVLRLSAQNTFLGNTTLNDGTTILDHSTTGSGAILPTPSGTGNALVLAGGAIVLSAGSALEQVASTTVSASASKISRSTGTSTIRLNNMARPFAATIDFGAAEIADTDNATVNGLLATAATGNGWAGGWATIAGNDWASTNGSPATGGNALITSLATYQTATDPTTWGATDNVSLAGNPSASVPTATINSLRLTGAAAVPIVSGGTLTVASGGILVTPTAGATSIDPASGTATLQGSVTNDLVIHQYSSSPLTISAVIANSPSAGTSVATRLAKSGPGKLILTGANTFTSLPYANEGILSISANNNLGDPAAGATFVFNGGTLEVTANVTFDNGGVNKRNFACGDVNGNTIDVTGANVATITGTIGGRSWITKAGTGTLVLQGASTTGQNDYLINAGTIRVEVPEISGTSGPFGNQTIPVPTSTAGYGCLLHFGGGALQYSALNNYDYSYRFWPGENQAYKVDVNGQTVTWASALNSAGGSLTVSDAAGGGKLSLTENSTYAGATTINSGTLALSGIGAINSSSEISIAAGATFDVSALSTYNLSGNTALKASGTATAAKIAGGTTVNLGTRPVTLAYDGTNPALTISSGGLTVGGNTWAVNGAALAPSSSYNIVTLLSGTATVSGTHTVYGSAIAGMTATIGGDTTANVTLTTSAALTASTTTLVSSAEPTTYGAPPTFTATVPGTGTVLFVVDGIPQLPAAAVSAGTATFTPAFNFPAGAHTIVANYSGDATYGSSVSTPLTQTVTPKALTIAGLVAGGSKVYDGTTTVELFGIPSLLASEAFGTGTSSDGKPYTGDEVGIIGLPTGSYNSKDVATASTVTFTGLRFNRAQAANYSISGTATATITPKALTVLSPAVTTRTYDGTTAATVSGTLQVAEAPAFGTGADGKPYTGDVVTLSLSAVFGNKNAGTGKTMDWTSSSIGGADVANYTLTLPTATTGIIDKTNITITAVTDTKNYDGTASSVGLPTLTAGTIQTGDTAPTWTQTFDNKNIGTGKTLTPAGLVIDGNGGANYQYTYAPDTTGVINAITLYASANGSMIYGHNPATAVYSPIFWPLQPGDTPAIVTGAPVLTTDALATSYVGSGYVVNVGLGTWTAPNYVMAFGSNGVMTVLPASLQVTNVTVADKLYDGTTNATIDVAGAGLEGFYNGDEAFVTLNSGSASGAFTNRNVGTGKTVVCKDFATTGDLGTNYVVVQPTLTATIFQTNITITAAADSKVYNGTTSSAGAPTITAGSIQTDDTAPTWTQTFDDRNVGTGKTLTPAGLVNDGNSGTNYAYIYATALGSVSQLALEVTAAANTKTYDGTVTAAALPTLTVGAIQTGDTAAFTETYDNRNVGTGKLLTAAGLVTDGNGGANYSYSYVPANTGVIDQAPLGVTAAATTKPYDGTTASAGTPTITTGTIKPGDTAPTWTQTYADKNAGTGKTLTPDSLVVTDGNGGVNYAYTYNAITTGVITKTNLTVTGVTDSRIYDGTVASVGVPTITAGTIQAGDTAPTWTQAFANKNAGTGKSLVPAGVVTDGNGGANYNYIYTPDTTGVISQTNLTVTAVTDSKLYDGTVASVGVPTITSGTIQTGDTAPTWTQTFNTKHVGTGKTLTPAGVVTDGNSGANYNYTYTPDTTGAISQTNITVTAVTDTKGYDGNTTSTAVPTVTSGAVQTGDTANFIEAFDTAAVGTGKTLTPSGTVTDGNSGANYAYTFTPDTTGVITNCCSAANSIVSIVNLGGGSFQLNFAGTEGAAYYVVTNALITAPMTAWNVATTTNTAGAGGAWSVTVNGAAPVYYRAAAVTPCP